MILSGFCNLLELSNTECQLEWFKSVIAVATPVPASKHKQTNRHGVPTVFLLAKESQRREGHLRSNWTYEKAELNWTEWEGLDELGLPERAHGKLRSWKGHESREIQSHTQTAERRRQRGEKKRHQKSAFFRMGSFQNSEIDGSSSLVIPTCQMRPCLTTPKVLHILPWNIERTSDSTTSPARGPLRRVVERSCPVFKHHHVRLDFTCALPLHSSETEVLIMASYLLNSKGGYCVARGKN